MRLGITAIAVIESRATVVHAGKHSLLSWLLLPLVVLASYG